MTTLLTITSVLCLFLIAAALLIPRLIGRSETTGSPTQSDLITLQTAISTFQFDTGRLPSAAEGLNALLVCPKNLSGWHGPYLARRPKDAWGNPYTYRLLPTGGFELRSAGQDGKLFTLDDNVLSN
jgi:general secretion pathway protein G